MTLPTIEAPTYTVTLPSNNQSIKFRPFLVKEEKILLTALESKEDSYIKNSMVQILSNCIYNDDIDFYKLPLFDIEYLFLQLRAKSVGEIAEPTMTCPKCKNQFSLKIDISKIKPKIKKDTVYQYLLDETGTLGVTLKYPNLDSSNALESDDDYLFILVDCIDEIFTDKEVFKAEDHTKEELTEFVEGMQTFQLEKILEFFRDIPTVQYEENYKCSCENTVEIKLRGLTDFFI